MGSFALPIPISVAGCNTCSANKPAGSIVATAAPATSFKVVFGARSSKTKPMSKRDSPAQSPLLLTERPTGLDLGKRRLCRADSRRHLAGQQRTLIDRGEMHATQDTRASHRGDLRSLRRIARATPKALRSQPRASHRSLPASRRQLAELAEVLGPGRRDSAPKPHSPAQQVPRHSPPRARLDRVAQRLGGNQVRPQRAPRHGGCSAPKNKEQRLPHFSPPFAAFPAGKGLVRILFIAEFNPIVGESTGRFANVTGGSLTMYALTNPIPLVFDEGGFSVPFDFD